MFFSISIKLNSALKYSAARTFFHEANQVEEKLSKIIFFIMVDMTPGCVFVPWIGYVFLIYFTSDLGNAAFELPCPMWYAIHAEFLPLIKVHHRFVSSEGFRLIAKAHMDF